VRRARATRIGVLFALALTTTAARCPRRAAQDPALVVPVPPPAAPSPGAPPTAAAEAPLPFTLLVPAGWAPTLPANAGAARFVHAATGATVAVWSAPIGEDALPTRADCTWAFDDTARYRAVRVASDVRVATCLPEEPGGARVTVWIVERSERGWRIEAAIPAGTAWAARPAVEELVGAIRFER
jgi:hypothetical protein